MYWHIWSKLMILSSENLTEDWNFGKRSIEIMGQQIGVGSELVMVIQWGMHWSKFRITEGPTFRSKLLSRDVWGAHFCFHKGLYVGQEQTQENLEGGTLEDIEVMNHIMLMRGPHLYRGWSARIISLAQLGIHWGKTSGDRTDRRLVLADEDKAEKDRIGSPIFGHHM